MKHSQELVFPKNLIPLPLYDPTRNCWIEEEEDLPFVRDQLLVFGMFFSE